MGGGPRRDVRRSRRVGSRRRVVLVDDQPALGGSLRYDLWAYPDGLGYETAHKLAGAVQSRSNIEVLTGATAFGLYEGNLLGVHQGSNLIKLRAKSVVAATGAYEQPLVYDRNDLPGTFLSSGLRRLMHLYRLRPGTAALVATTNDEGLPRRARPPERRGAGRSARRLQAPIPPRPRRRNGAALQGHPRPAVPRRGPR